jgi:hypothetical protein
MCKLNNLVQTFYITVFRVITPNLEPLAGAVVVVLGPDDEHTKLQCSQLATC